MSIEKRELERCLSNKFGFQLKDGPKHERFILKLDGKKVAITTMSRSWRVISDSMLSMIAKQLHVDRRTLEGMCACTMSRDAYVVLLRTRDSTS